MTRIVFLSISFLFIGSAASAKGIALSFDDAPRGATRFFSGEARAEALIGELKKASVFRAVFFCNTENFTEQGKQRIQKYVEAGHLIANHAHSHPDLNASDPKEYWENVMRADAILRAYPAFRPWFRLPFLREGKTEEIRDFIREKMRGILPSRTEERRSCYAPRKRGIWRMGTIESGSG